MRDLNAKIQLADPRVRATHHAWGVLKGTERTQELGEMARANRNVWPMLVGGPCLCISRDLLPLLSPSPSLPCQRG